MSIIRVDLSRRGLLECGSVSTILIALVCALLSSTRYLAWTWDALNHQIYLGMIATSPRWHNDVAAAASQTYQYPFLYWPVYQLSLMSGSGAVAASIWAGVQTALVMPPIWLLAYRLIPDGAAPWQSRALRFLACALALASLPILASLGTTANDVLASVPVLWAIALGIGFPGSWRCASAAAGLLGVGIALKYSNVLFLPLLLLAWWQPNTPRLPFGLGVRIAVFSAAGFVLTYLPWAWQLWTLTGNPFYPHFGKFFGT
jgi:hypothetical protein